MFYHLIYPLYKYLSVLNVFRYITFRAALAVVVSLLVFVFFGRKFIVLVKRRTHQVLRQHTPKGHQKKSGTPGFGGILIIASVLVSILMCGNLASPTVILCIITFIGFGLIGFIDDYLKESKLDGKGIASRFKFGAQVFLSLFIACYIYYFHPNDYFIINGTVSTISTTAITIPFLSHTTFDLGIWYIPFVVFVITATSNAVNMTDGLDGLAIGLVLLVIIGVTILGYFSGHRIISEYLKIPYIPHVGEISVLAAALAGACLGFLWYNCFPAQVFMGDTGSLSLGAVIGLFAVILKIELLLPILGGMFVIETLSVIIQVVSYKLRKKRVFRMAPLHHHFELVGWSENKIIIRFWITGALFALMALASLKIR